MNNCDYVTLTSMSLLPSEINSIFPRLIIIKNNLAILGSIPYSWNSWTLSSVIWSDWFPKSIIPMGYFAFTSGYDRKSFIGSRIYSLKINFVSLYSSL